MHLLISHSCPSSSHPTVLPVYLFMFPQYGSRVDCCVPLHTHSLSPPSLMSVEAHIASAHALALVACIGIPVALLRSSCCRSRSKTLNHKVGRPFHFSPRGANCSLNSHPFPSSPAGAPTFSTYLCWCSCVSVLPCVCCDHTENPKVYH